MKKQTIALLAAILAFAGTTHAEEKKSTQQIMMEDARLDHTTCLRMISSMKCDGHGDESYSSATCKLQIAYRLSSGEIALFPIESNDSKSHNPDTGLGIAVRMTTAFLSLGGTEALVASAGASGSVGRAEDAMRVQLSQIAEFLQLKDIKKCQDFKDDSKTVFNNSSSHVSE